MGERHAADEARLQHAQAALRPDVPIRRRSAGPSPSHRSRQPRRPRATRCRPASPTRKISMSQRSRQVALSAAVPTWPPTGSPPATSGRRRPAESRARPGRSRAAPAWAGAPRRTSRRFLHPRIEGLQREPEMDPDAAVNPDHQQQDRLQEPGGRRGAELVELLRVALVGAEQAQGDPRAEHVVGEQERDVRPRTSCVASRRRPAELPPLVERPEAEAHVGQRARRRERAPPGATARSASGPRARCSIAATEMLPSAWFR